MSPRSEHAAGRDAEVKSPLLLGAGPDSNPEECIGAVGANDTEWLSGLRSAQLQLFHKHTYCRERLEKQPDPTGVIRPKAEGTSLVPTLSLSQVWGD